MKEVFQVIMSESHNTPDYSVWKVVLFSDSVRAVEFARAVAETYKFLTPMALEQKDDNGPALNFDDSVEFFHATYIVGHHRRTVAVFSEKVR